MSLPAVSKTSASSSALGSSRAGGKLSGGPAASRLGPQGSSRLGGALPEPLGAALQSARDIPASDESESHVRAICMRLCADAQRAEESAQDAWVRVRERLATWRGEAAFGTWLHRLTVNVVLEMPWARNAAGSLG